MTIPQRHMDKATFLDWVERRAAPDQEGRCELVGGFVVMMMRPVRGHALIVGNLLVALRERLDHTRWDVLSDFGTETGIDTVRAPDIVVVPAGGSPKDRTTTLPVLVAEVLSPSTVTVDLGDKAAEYLGLDSLVAYLVVAQDEPKVWLWVRGENGFPAGPQPIAGRDAMARTPPLGLDLPLSEVFAGIVQDEDGAEGRAE
ncbi:hypothetical protein A33M_0694 [Rhodovulum sp. PH10]|uniref:Uma2 family endonuclease n=1 Tax=Rhodovulum sp. PH10 TaxID=1187851 RepID=UPI00027C2CA3|nr:Uma2 family endonuclease [Rhodovulum sp. PH10]EJW09982.1 hypothetical protein A33M_0694 [Rhodovulum sp. PH10]